MARRLSDRITAAELPRCMAVDDGRGRVTDLRVFVKRWAHAGHACRAAMISAAPRRRRWLDRFTRRRHDLARIAAVVHALCERDGVLVPGWVYRHRCWRAVSCVEGLDVTSPWMRMVLADAPTACAFHNVWFDQTMIEDHTIHGFREVAAARAQ